jgi:hypothetical protein
MDSDDEPDTSAVSDIDPVIGTPILDLIDESDIVLNRGMRENVASRVRRQIQQRRTVDGISERLMSITLQPVTDAMQTELSNKVKDNIKSQIEQRRD